MRFVRYADIAGSKPHIFCFPLNASSQNSIIHFTGAIPAKYTAYPDLSGSAGQ